MEKFGLEGVLCLGTVGREEGATGKQANSSGQGSRKFWFRSGRGYGPGLALLRGALPLCGRASYASCAPSCPCGGGVGNGGLAELVQQSRRDREGWGWGGAGQ